MHLLPQSCKAPNIIPQISVCVRAICRALACLYYILSTKSSSEIKSQELADLWRCEDFLSNNKGSDTFHTKPEWIHERPNLGSHIKCRCRFQPARTAGRYKREPPRVPGWGTITPSGKQHHQENQCPNALASHSAHLRK